MITHRLPLVAVLAAFVLSLTACEDPSNVGENLVGGISGEPETIVLPAAQFEAEPYEDVSGQSPRVLVGVVTDPVFGTISATGYVDFNAGTNVTNDFRSGTVTAAELRLEPDGYVYGDTTGAVTLRLRDFPQELVEEDVPADTTLQPGGIVTEFTFLPTDTLVVVPLPQEWIAANDTTLRSSTFISSFHGLIFEPVSGNAVVGLDAAETELVVVAEGDTVRYPVSTQTAYTAHRTGEVTLPPNTLFIQDAVGPQAELAFAFDDSLQSLAINRVLVALPADTAAVTNTEPANFYRPPLRAVTLYVELESGVLALDFVLDDGVYVLASPQFAAVVQQMLLGKLEVEHISVAPDRDQNTINPMVFYELEADEENPRAIVTVTPIDQ